MGGKTDIRWNAEEWAALEAEAAARGVRPGQVVKVLVLERLEASDGRLRAARDLAAVSRGPAAPEGRESGVPRRERARVSAGGAGSRVTSSPPPASSRPAGRAVGLLDEFAAAPVRDVGGAFPAREVPCEGGCGTTIAWDGLCAVCEAEFAAGRDDCPAGLQRTTGGGAALLADHLGVERPSGLAGSGVPVPPAGGGAASVVDSPPAADAPAGGVSLVSAAAASLVARGLASSESQARVLALRAIRSGMVEVSGEVCRDPQRLVDPRDLA